jgi:flagellar basal-body rod protein FlgF
MSGVMNVIESAMRADAEAARVIGQNIANAEVTAYRRQIPLAAASFASVLDQSNEAAAAPPRVAMDFKPGALRSTGEPTHVALEGAGFFVLASGSGARLTRRGDFAVSSTGVLVSANGDAVLGGNGPIQVGSSVPTIDNDGTIKVGDQVIDRLRIVDVADPSRLQYLGDGTFLAAPEHFVDAASVSLLQGHLEAANVTPIGEMVQLMETVRHFEAAQRYARGYDEMLQKAISELGKAG